MVGKPGTYPEKDSSVNPRVEKDHDDFSKKKKKKRTKTGNVIGQEKY